MQQTQKFGDHAIEILKIFACHADTLPRDIHEFAAVESLIRYALESYQDPIIEEISDKIRSLIHLAKPGHIHEDDFLDLGRLYAYKDMYEEITGEEWEAK